MADISKIQINGSTYSLKDEVARKAVSELETALSSPLVFKGTISNQQELLSVVFDATAKIGDTYKVSSSIDDDTGSYGHLEIGDMLICIDTLDWTVLQSNVDVFQGATIAAAGWSGLVPAPGIAETDKVLCSDGTWKSIAQFTSWGSISDLI